MRKAAHNRRLQACIDLLIQTAESSMAWEESDAAKLVSRDYRYLLDYLTKGADDPQRQEVYFSLVERTLSLIDRLERRLLSVSKPSLYFSTLRVANSQNKNIDTFIEDYINDASSSDNLFAKITANTDIDMTSDKLHTESSATELFNALWVAYPLDSITAKKISDLINDETSDYNARSLFLSAVMLGELEFHDATRIDILTDTYLYSDDLRLRAQALVALLVCLYRYRDRRLEQRIEDKIKLLKDAPGWSSHLTTAFMEFIRTRDTERINRKMTDEIIPTMMNLRPEIMKRFEGKMPESIDSEDIELNPEWEDILNKSGLTEQIKQMSEIQQDGGDVFMSTFSHLKRFPFFHDAANWFLPFDPENSRVLEAVDNHLTTAQTIASLPFLCDSDKFSLALSLKMVPEHQKSMMFEQLDAHRANIFEEAHSANSTDADSMRLNMRAFLQNYYRFLKLFRRKGEFYNPFDKGVNLLLINSICDDIDDTRTLQIVAEFFFKLGYWDDALNLFSRIKDSGIHDNPGAIWQKIGYCNEQIHNIPEAIDAYEKSRMLNQESRWLTRRLYVCYRSIGNHRKALEFAQCLAQNDVANMSAAMTLGYALIEAGKYREAIAELHRAEFIDESSTRPFRPLAWTLFLIKDFDGALKYYGKIRENNPTPTDFLNMGHLAMAMKDYREAFKLYKEAIAKGIDINEFYNILADDSDALRSAGVDMDIIPLMADAVISNTNNSN